MYLDLAAMDKYSRYSIKFAHIVGLNAAVYWSAIMNILVQVSKKKTYDENGFFTLSRSYVEEITTLTKEQQYECDDILSKLEVLKIDPNNQNRLWCDIKQFFEIIVDDKVTDFKALKSLATKSKKECSRANKREGILARLLDRVSDPDPDIRNAYAGFLNVVYDKGFLKNEQIDIFQDTLNKYTDDKQAKLDILGIATTNGYKLCEWSIGIYEKSHKPGSHLGTQKINTAVREDIEF